MPGAIRGAGWGWSTTGDYTLSWGASAGAASYELQERVGSGGWSAVQSGPERTKEIVGKQNGIYRYRARACSGGGLCSGWTGTKRVDVQLIVPPVPGGITGVGWVSTTGDYTLSWGASENAAIYELQERVGSGGWTEAQSGPERTKAFTAKPNGIYRYRARACLSGGLCSGWTGSRRVDVQLVVPPMPGAITGVGWVSTTGDYTLSWGASEGTAVYELQERVGSGSWTEAQSSSERTKAFTAKPNGIYRYRARACLSGGQCSGWTGTKRVDVKLAPPPVPGAVTGVGFDWLSTTGDYTLSWGASEGAASYQLRERVGSGGWAVVQDGPALTKEFTGKQDGIYRYRVRACLSGGLCSDWTGSKRVDVQLPSPDAPEAITGPDRVVEDSYTLSWSEPAGTVTGYDLERRRGDGAWEALTVESTEPLSYRETERTNGEWVYRLRACNGRFCSAYGPVKTVTVAIPAGVETPPAPATPTAASLVTQAEVDDTDKAGATAGAFRVDERGAATYSVPIMTVAGTAGVAPEVALVYNSNAGNGIMGLGWSISGLSSIMRCRPTLHQDGASKPIQWNAEDRFCLDGQRLLLASGTYGSPNSTYKTEVDSFVKVAAKGGTAGHPDYWEVTAKDGSKRTYGGTSSSAPAEARGGSATLSWALSKFEDSIGNRMLYRYYNDVDGQRIKGIRYAYGSGATAATHQAYLRFWYEDRDDDLTSYVAGRKFAAGKRLQRVESHNRVGGAWHNLRSYKIAYKPLGTGVLDKTSKAASIEECVGSKCLPKTVFEWQDEAHGFKAEHSGMASLATMSDRGLHRFQPADINGDGMMDLAWLEWEENTNGFVTSYKLKYALSNGSALMPATFSDGGGEIVYTATTTAPLGSRIRTLDYNADGRADIAVWNGISRTWGVRLSRPGSGGWKLDSAVINTSVSEPFAHFTDINGDGLVDAVYVLPYGDRCQCAVTGRYLEKDPEQGDESSRPYRFGSEMTLYTYTPPEPLPVGRHVRVAIEAGGYDFNGDGRADILANFSLFQAVYRPEESYLYHKDVVYGPLVMNAGGQWEISRNFIPAETSTDTTALVSRLMAADFNSDGLTDILRFRRAGDDYHYYIHLSTGTGFDLVDPGFSTPVAIRRLGFLDHNGDGHPDVTWRDSRTGTSALKSRLWDPATGSLESTDRAITTAAMANRAGNNAHLFLDMDGDSHEDYVFVMSSGLYSYPSNNAGKFPGLITKITDGLGAETRISYGTLAKTANYERLDAGRAGAGRFCYGQGQRPGTDDCEAYGTASDTQSDIDAFYRRLNGSWKLPSGAQTLGKTAPVLEVLGAMPVTTLVAVRRPIRGNTEYTAYYDHYYAEAKVQASGRGFLGFEKTMVRDSHSGVATTTSYRQDWPFTGRAFAAETRSREGHLLESEATTFRLDGFSASWEGAARAAGTAALGPLQVHAERVVRKRYDLLDDGVEAGDLVSTATTSTAYDAYGNATSVTVLTEGGGRRYMTETANTYGPTDADRETGRLTRAVVKKRRDEDSNRAWEKTSTRRSDFNYYGQADCPVSGTKFAGMLCQEILEPEHSALKVVTTHSYDTWGNRVKSKVEAGTGSAKLTRCDAETATYDAHGRWVETTRDCLGRKQTQVMARSEHGLPTDVRHYLNTAGTTSRTSTYAYTARGAKYFETDGTGAWTARTAKHGGHALCPPRTKMHVRERAAGGGEAITCLDRLGREARIVARGFDGRWVTRRDTHYDYRGEAAWLSEPYWQGESQCQTGSASSTPQTRCWTQRDRDILGRVIETTRPDGSETLTAYTGLTVTVTNDLDQTLTETRNVLGELISTEDNEGAETEFEYDAQGNLTLSRVKKASGAGPTAVTTTMAYDLLGRKTSVDDPDKGNWTYEYNALGELTKQTAATGNYTQTAYDGLGRMSSRKDYAGTDLEASAAWTWDTAAHGLGQLDNVQDSVSGYVKIAEYDSLGRLSETVTSLGADGALGDHYEKITYDEFGRTFQLFDASRVTADYADGGVRYVYNERGYLHKVRDAVRGSDGAPRREYRRILSTDARGGITEERLGNGVARKRQRDGRTGRLLGLRGTKNAAGDVQDVSYQWDAIGNLTRRREQSGNKDLTETFAYDGLNRLKSSTVASRSTVTATYDSYGNLRSKSDVGSYAYFADRPNTLKTAGGATYAWDANGNNTSGDGRTLTYTVFDKVETVTKGTHATAFEYGPDRMRYLRADTETGQTTTTLYIGGVEKVAHPDGRREVRRYIDGLVIETKKYGADGTLTGTDEQYVLKDHLGSVDVITDEDGAVAQEMSFDPWGQRRNAADWSSLSGSALTDFDASRTPRGFTGHEHLDEAGIIHMNGRIHDPKLGRFLQADPYVQNPRLPGGHNRYAYAMNNPLNAVDPSGFNCWNHDNYGESDCSRPDRFPEPPDYIDRDRPDNDLRDLYNFLVWVSYHLGQFSETGSWNIALGATNPGIASSNISSILPGAVSSLQQGASLPTGTTEEQLTDIAAGQTCSDETGCKFANGAATVAYEISAESQRKRIGRKPGGDDGPTVTFNNDIPGGDSADHPVHPNLADVFMDVLSTDAVRDAGIVNVNVNSTVRSSTGPHSDARSADINRINDMRVDDDNPANRHRVRVLQEALKNHPNTNQILGPEINENLWDGSLPPEQELIDLHKDHIHVTVYPDRR